MDLKAEVQKLILDSLRNTVPKAVAESKDLRAPTSAPKTNPNLDSSTKVLGFTKITKKNYTP
jgi:hypothetical protein